MLSRFYQNTINLLKTKNVIKIAIIALILGFSSLFPEPFYMPKLVLFCLLGLIIIIDMLLRKDLLLPSYGILIFTGIFFVLGTISIFGSINHISSIQGLAYYICGFLLYIGIINIADKDVKDIIKIFIALAVAGVFIAVLQYLSVPVLPNQIGKNIGFAVVGTLGNEEFLATLFGISLIFTLQFYSEQTSSRKKYWLLAIAVLIFAGIVLTKTKGTMLFFLIYAVWKIYPKPKVILSLFIASGLFLTIFFSYVFKGRLLLWLASIIVIKNNLLFGVGLKQAGSHYLGAVYELFDRFPLLSDFLGGNTAVIADFHNIILNFGCELGIGGIILAIAYLGYLFKIFKHENEYAKLIILFLIFKSFYTVLLSSVSALVIAAVITGIYTKKYAIQYTVRKRLIVRCTVICFIPILLYNIYTMISDYYYQKGNNLLINGDIKSAETQFQKSIRINPENSNSYLSLAHVYFLEHKKEQMDENIKKSIFYQNNMNTYKISAHMYYYSNMTEEAFPLYLFLNKVFPEHLTSMTKLAQIYYGLGEYHNAYKTALRVLDTEPRLKMDSDYNNKLIASGIINKTAPAIFKKRGIH